MALKIPLSSVVSFMSHSATGRTKLIPSVSRRTDDRIIPDIKIKM